jgi:UDPglucose 6-dehydrogenase
VNIVIIGSGYVGTTAAALFSVSGHNVTAIDLDPKKVETINSGKAPFYEAGVNEIISAGLERGTLVATSEYETAVSAADIVFSCVGTPDNPDGSSNLAYIFGSAKEASKYLKKGAIFVQKSTVPVGTGREVTKLLPEGVSYVSNPEFLRESTAVYDTLMFDRIVAGGEDEEANEAILDLHRTVENHFEDISRISGIAYTSGHTGSYLSTRLESAELIKVTSNAFLALKISFANSIAQLSDATGANVQEVMSIVGEDQRIGKAFFSAGRGYGGGCFPKDVSGLISSAKGFNVDMPIMEAASTVNDRMPAYIIDKLTTQYDSLKNIKIAVLGLAFKSGTSDARRSPAIQLANLLVEKGAIVTAFDPQANHEAKSDLSSSVTVANSHEDAVAEARIVVIATDWPEFEAVSAWTPNATNLELLVDAVNCVDLGEVKQLGIRYIGVGRRI